MGEYRRSKEREKAYAKIAEAGLLDGSLHKNHEELCLTAAIGFLSRIGPLFAPLIEHPVEDVRNFTTEVVARLAVEHLQDLTIAAAELVRATAARPLPLQPLARQYIVGRTGMKAGDALSRIDRERAGACYNAVLDAIATMEVSKRDPAIDAMTALEGPLVLVATWLQLYRQDS